MFKLCSYFLIGPREIRVLFFFFSSRRRHTRWTGDWSSDVCSADLVVRDATALTGSVMGGTLGLSDRVYTLDAPLNDTTRSGVWTQELRLTGASSKIRWLVGSFFADSKRDYGQNVRPVGVDSLAAAEGFAGGNQGWSQGNLGAGIDVLF